MIFNSNPRRLIARSISELMALGLKKNHLIPGLRILMYHSIGSKAFEDAKGLFSISPERFQDHMKILSDWTGGRVSSLSEETVPNSRSDIAITFDDGYQDNLKVAAPILSKFGFPFTVFVTSEFVRQHQEGFLTPSDLRELASFPGANIGAHGANHVDLCKCDKITLHNELYNSRAYLEDVLGKDILTIAYPFGATNNYVRSAALVEGYNLGVCSFAGVNTPERNRMFLRRTEIVSFDDHRVFTQKINGKWDWYRWRMRDPACH